jgi:hypothetical protein
MWFFVKWEGGSTSFVPARQLNKIAPNKVIQYYESIVQYQRVEQKITSEPGKNREREEEIKIDDYSFENLPQSVQKKIEENLRQEKLQKKQQELLILQKQQQEQLQLQKQQDAYNVKQQQQQQQILHQAQQQLHQQERYQQLQKLRLPNQYQPPQQFHASRQRLLQQEWFRESNNINININNNNNNNKNNINENITNTNNMNNNLKNNSINITPRTSQNNSNNEQPSDNNNFLKSCTNCNILLSYPKDGTKCIKCPICLHIMHV